MKDLDRAIFKIVETIEETNKDDIFTILNYIGVNTTNLRVHNAIKRLVKSGYLAYAVGFRNIVLADNPPPLKGFYTDSSMAVAMRCIPSLKDLGIRLESKFKRIREKVTSGKTSLLDTPWHLKIYKDMLVVVLNSVKLNIMLIDKVGQLPPIRVRIAEVNNHITKFRKQ